MKKIITTIFILIALTGNSMAYTHELNNNEYINKLNTYVGEMKLETDVSGGSILKSLVSGVDEGYLQPDISKLEKIRNSLCGLISNIENESIQDKELQARHNEFISESKIVVKLLDKDINAKKEVLETQVNGLVKIGKLLKIDNNESKKVNDHIEKANEIYKEMNEKF